ncbi:hypothetical protein FF1_033588 [Malus domestica]
MRELKVAGVDSTQQRKRKSKGTDDNAEIPFEMPPEGFYDATDDVYGPVEQPKFPTSIEELEGKTSAPSAILQANKLNSVVSVRNGSKLTLSAPQISDDELG